MLLSYFKLTEEYVAGVGLSSKKTFFSSFSWEIQCLVYDHSQALSHSLFKLGLLFLLMLCV